jgi:hypothetical protein
LSEGAEGEFCDEYCSGFVEALDYCGVVVEGLVFVRCGAPCGGIAFDGE